MTQEAKKRALKLLQGYVWHPREENIDLAHYLPKVIEPDIQILWDEMPQAPFTFFDDGTLSATQQFYQFTVIAVLQDEQQAAQWIPELAETLQAKLNETPEGVGWQIFEDLREV